MNQNLSVEVHATKVELANMTSIQLCAHNFTTSAATLADLNIAIAVTAAAVCNETALRGRHDNQIKKVLTEKTVIQNLLDLI